MTGLTGLAEGIATGEEAIECEDHVTIAGQTANDKQGKIELLSLGC